MTMTEEQKNYNKSIERTAEEKEEEEEEPTEEIQSVRSNSSLVCIKCKQKKQCSKDRYQKLVSKYGSEDELHKSYVCRSCRKD